MAAGFDAPAPKGTKRGGAALQSSGIGIREPGRPSDEQTAFIAVAHPDQPGQQAVTGCELPRHIDLKQQSW